MTPPNGYFVGIGSMRSGTTWMGHHLRACDGIGLPNAKEVHFWTSKYSDELKWSVFAPRRFLKSDAERVTRGFWNDPIRVSQRLAFYFAMMTHSEWAYRKYLSLWGDAPRTVGEMTPAYAILNEDGFRAIERCLDQPKYFFMLRNPADRFISHISHRQKHGNDVFDLDVGRMTAAPVFAVRSDYLRTIELVRSIAGPERLHILFYEDLFDPTRGQETCDALCEYLGVGCRPAHLDFKSNTSVTKRPKIDRDEIVYALAAQYTGIAEAVGREPPENWRKDLKMLESRPG